MEKQVERIRKFLVPIVEEIPSERAVELACQLANDQCALLVLVHVIVVPYTLALDAPMPQLEAAGREAIELGRKIASRYGCSSTQRVVRHRHVADGVLQAAREEQADAIVLGVGVDQHIPGEWGITSAEILDHAECEVIIAKMHNAAQSTSAAA